MKNSSNRITSTRQCVSTDLSPPNTLNRLNWYSTSEEEVKELFRVWGQPSFRLAQIKKWVYEKGVIDFSQMKDIPSDLRSKLAEVFTFGSLRLASEQVSKDGTKKRAYELFDGQLIESVLMPYDDGRNTACISSQAGCGMARAFPHNLTYIVHIITLFLKLTGLCLLCDWANGVFKTTDFC
jgi:hypothetical protein